MSGLVGAQAAVGCGLIGVVALVASAASVTLTSKTATVEQRLAGQSLLFFNCFAAMFCVAYAYLVLTTDDFQLWEPVRVEHTRNVTAEYVCCSLSNCVCTNRNATAGPNCTAALASLQVTAACVNQGYCCEMDTASCDCGGTSAGSAPVCVCSRCATYQPCAVACATCHRAQVQLSFADWSGSRGHVNVTCDCANDTSDARCLEQLLQQWPPGLYWNEHGTTLLAATASLSRFCIILIAFSAALAAGAVAQCAICALVLCRARWCHDSAPLLALASTSTPASTSTAALEMSECGPALGATPEATPAQLLT